MSFMNVSGYAILCSECGAISSMTLDKPEFSWLGDCVIWEQREIVASIPKSHQKAKDILGSGDYYVAVGLCDACFEPQREENERRQAVYNDIGRRESALKNAAAAVAQKALGVFHERFNSKKITDLIEKRLARAAQTEPVKHYPRNDMIWKCIKEITESATPPLCQPGSDDALKLERISREAELLSKEASEIGTLYVASTLDEITSVISMRSDLFLNQKTIMLNVPILSEGVVSSKPPELRIWREISTAIGDPISTAKNALEHGSIRFTSSMDGIFDVRERLRERFDKAMPPALADVASAKSPEQSASDDVTFAVVFLVIAAGMLGGAGYGIWRLITWIF